MKKKNYRYILLLTSLLLALIIVNKKGIKQIAIAVFTNGVLEKKIVIVIDPGHGGNDPGKVGVDNSLEKELNLVISIKLKHMLEANDFSVILTREDDNGLYDSDSTNKKRTDLNRRIELIKNSNADLAISIHQNSFSDESIKGAQVFYHNTSEEGKTLASYIQEQLKKTLKDGNHRTIKSNNNYYMLKKSTCPLVIVECGYLSNYNEAKLLSDNDYQERVAWAIHLAVIEFINTELKN